VSVVQPIRHLTRLIRRGDCSGRTLGEPADAADILKAVQEPQLIYDPVPKAVWSPKNDAPSLVEAIET
jgi:hypothetical protein